MILQRGIKLINFIFPSSIRTNLEYFVNILATRIPETDHNSFSKKQLIIQKTNDRSFEYPDELNVTVFQGIKQRAYIRIKSLHYEVLHEKGTTTVKLYLDDKIQSRMHFYIREIRSEAPFETFSNNSLPIISSRYDESNKNLVEIKINIELYILDRIQWPNEKINKILTQSSTGRRFVSISRLWKQPGFHSQQAKGPIVRHTHDLLQAEIGRLSAINYENMGLNSATINYEMSIHKNVPDVLKMFSLLVVDNLEKEGTT